MELRGSCHCGSIRWVMEWPGHPDTIPGRVCTCGFCSRHGASWTAHPQARLAIEASDPGVVARYAFGTRTAEFWICRRCGTVPACTSRIEGRDYAVVNVNTLDDDLVAVERLPVSFDGEGEAERLDRRKARWIGTVRA